MILEGDVHRRFMGQDAEARADLKPQSVEPAKGALLDSGLESGGALLNTLGGRVFVSGGGGGGLIEPSGRTPPFPKKGSIDRTPKILDLGGDPDPKIGKKRKWDFWNQRVEGVQKSHHLPYIW